MCIRDRYQRRVRGLPFTTMEPYLPVPAGPLLTLLTLPAMAHAGKLSEPFRNPTLNLSLAGAAPAPALAVGLAALIIAAAICLNARISQMIGVDIFARSGEDNLRTELRKKELEKQNQLLQKVWVAQAVAGFWGVFWGPQLDFPAIFFVVTVLPLAVGSATMAVDTKYNWLNCFAQHLWFAALMATTANHDAATTLAPLVGIFLWSEASPCSLGALLASHAAGNLTVFSASPDTSISCLAMSAFLIAVFCYRRSRPLHDPPGMDGERSSTWLHTCDHLVNQILESKNQMSPTSRQAALHLQQLLGAVPLGDAMPSKTMLDDPTSSASVVAGTGSGGSVLPPPIRSSADPGLEILAGTALRPRLRPVETQHHPVAPKPMVPRPEHGAFMSDPTVGHPAGSWMAAARRHSENFESHRPSQPQSGQPSVGGLAMYLGNHMESQPGPQSLPSMVPSYFGTVNPMLQQQQQQQQQMQMHHMQQMHQFQSQQNPYAQNLLRMSYDAMAAVDARTGILLWTNEAFYRISKLRGGGDVMLGLACLQDRLCQHASGDSHLNWKRDQFMDGEACVTLWSTTQLVGSVGQEVLLWVIHHTMEPAGMVNDTKPGVPPAQWHSANREDPREEVLPAYPKASDYPDPHSKIVNEPAKCCGRGRRPTLMLWQKYGQKCLFKSAPGPDSTIGSGSILRLYYKCYATGCRAKLKIDIDQTTGERTSVSPCGVHNHHVTLATVCSPVIEVDPTPRLDPAPSRSPQLKPTPRLEPAPSRSPQCKPVSDDKTSDNVSE
eukprot:TRINITY_DN87_c0_g1_i4.p1 TRINITY_DN87_c0_g1~~TRINITY_DN87_c0_g1_i4.p1  ORF type:complete len:778 (+),score=144.83 TRINITY_DN87_c0_g1_i4:132-2465(+)